MSSWQYIYQSLYGAWRLAHFDSEGMKHFDLTVSGFWRSFQSMIVALPLFIVLAILEKKIRILVLAVNSPGVVPDFDNYYLAQALDYLVIWPAFALLMIPFTRLMAVDRYYVPLIVAYNWARLVSIAILIPAYALLGSGILSTEVSGLITLITSVVVIFYQWFVIKTALGNAKLMGLAVMILDIVLALVISYFLTSLLSGNPDMAS